MTALPWPCFTAYFSIDSRVRRLIATVLIALLGYWISPSPALARLGATRQECFALYGPPTATDESGLTTTYRDHDTNVTCTFPNTKQNARCIRMNYTIEPFPPSSPDELDALMRALLTRNHQDKRWSTPQKKRDELSGYLEWAREDGAVCHLRADQVIFFAPKRLGGVEYAGPMMATGNPPVIDLSCGRIEESLRHVDSTDNATLIQEGLDTDVSYLAPRRDGEHATVIYRFEVEGQIEKALLSCNTFCVDFTKNIGTARGSAAIEMSVDGTTWITLMDQIGDYSWGENWSYDGDLPDVVRGASSVWLRVTLLTQGSESKGYSCAQFGRTHPDGRSPVLVFKAQLKQ